ncbi:tyrosine-type recombinase/integrase [uncultured Jannaschia sp.]|uniref:tyrosine-type recombinase/integrase n=1 Tax=uncultured Jannaschia sp. TaxID=293347 RepID=UPI0026169D6E|nr:tyrosine-type recombinase/integrase [uncultured Jannaschia sp.]
MTNRRSVKSADGNAADAHERGRDYLGQPQVDRLLQAAKKGRHGVRDHLLLLMVFRHGLRVSEAVALRGEHVDLLQSRLWVARLKNGLSVEHPVAGDELRVIKRWLARRDDDLPWLFVSERR